MHQSKPKTTGAASLANPKKPVAVRESAAIKPVAADMEKPAKKAKAVRDKFTMPKADYDKLAELKNKCLAAGVRVKKSELLRTGLRLLETLPITKLKAAVVALDKVETGHQAIDQVAKSGRLNQGH